VIKTFCGNNECDRYAACGDSIANAPFEKRGSRWMRKGAPDNYEKGVPPFAQKWGQPDLADCFKGIEK
jgi:hypothetical protein